MRSQALNAASNRQRQRTQQQQRILPNQTCRRDRRTRRTHAPNGNATHLIRLLVADVEHPNSPAS
uniref:Uncharacterized protein n=1 Tax=Mycobacterium marinum DL240490 TaxID=459420 RepID=B6CLS3_MYCMR|nr:hypothetical protein MUDP_087 [Mycobacterium marinum DL240490]